VSIKIIVNKRNLTCTSLKKDFLKISYLGRPNSWATPKGLD